MGDPIIDIHFHFGARPDSQSGCCWSAEFMKTPTYYAISLITGSLFKDDCVFSSASRVFSLIRYP
jgi:hypothetical protein